MQITIRCDNIYELEKIARSLVNGFGTGTAEEPELTEAEKAAAEVLKMTEQKLSVKEMLDTAIRNIKDTAPEPKEEPAPEPKPKKPAQRRMDTFDYGKLGALLDGGWNVAKIADEFGVSEQTIYNKMKKMRQMKEEKSR